VHQAVGTGAVIGMPRLVLRGEGLALFCLGTMAFSSAGLSWWLFAALFLAPDIGLAGYLAGPRIGAIAYNALHTITLPVSLAVLGMLGESTLLWGVAAIWTAHIGFDRMLGYGLKYSTEFGHTHLGRVGRASAAA
jgi:Domain of unknown function (DUF4260)